VAVVGEYGAVSCSSVREHMNHSRNHPPSSSIIFVITFVITFVINFFSINV
jgi:hypothetical protein